MVLFLDDLMILIVFCYCGRDGKSRVTHPAWTYRDLEQTNWYYPQLNPQENVCFPFQNNLSTRILEKNNYVTKIPCFPFLR